MLLSLLPLLPRQVVVAVMLLPLLPGPLMLLLLLLPLQVVVEAMLWVLLPGLPLLLLLPTVLGRWVLEPSAALSAPGVPGMVPVATVGTLGRGGLLGLKLGNALLGGVVFATHTTPDGVLAGDLEVVITLALITPHRFTVVRPQGVAAPHPKVKACHWCPYEDNKDLPGGGAVSADKPFGRNHSLVCLYSF